MKKFFILSFLLYGTMAWAAEPNELQRLRIENAELKQTCDKLRKTNNFLREENEKLKKQIADSKSKKIEPDKKFIDFNEPVGQYTFKDFPAKSDKIEKSMIGGHFYGEGKISSIKPDKSKAKQYEITIIDTVTSQRAPSGTYAKSSSTGWVSLFAIISVDEETALQYERGVKVVLVGDISTIEHQPRKAKGEIELIRVKLENWSIR